MAAVAKAKLHSLLALALGKPVSSRNPKIEGCAFSRKAEQSCSVEVTTERKSRSSKFQGGDKKILRLQLKHRPTHGRRLFPAKYLNLFPHLSLPHRGLGP